MADKDTGLGGEHVERSLGFIPSTIFLVNNVIGSGLIALPAVYQEAGWVLSTTALCVIALFSMLAAAALVEVHQRTVSAPLALGIQHVWLAGSPYGWRVLPYVKAAIQASNSCNHPGTPLSRIFLMCLRLLSLLSLTNQNWVIWSMVDVSRPNTHIARALLTSVMSERSQW